MTTGFLSGLIDSVVTAPKEPNRDYIGASSIGNPCLRSLYYSYNGFEGEDYTNKTLRTFSVGNILENMILDLVEKTGIELIRPSKFNHFLEVFDEKLPVFRGHLDAIMVNAAGENIAILEIKTARNSSFNIFKNKGLQEWNQSYYSQVQAYMGMKGIPFTYELAFNKDTSMLHDEKIEFDPIHYESLQSKVEVIKSAVSLPPRVNASPLWYLCRTCKFREECHFKNREQL